MSMSFNKITEKAVPSSVDSGAKILITQEVTVGGQTVEDVRRATLTQLADALGMANKAATAPNFDDLTFPVKAGQLCWYSGVLYKAKSDIATSESWTEAHWEETLVAGEIADLKTATVLGADGQMALTLSAYELISCTISADNKCNRSADKYKSRQIPINLAWHTISVTAQSGQATSVTFLTTPLPVTPTQNMSMTSYLATGETGRHLVTAGATVTLEIPSTAEYIVIAVKSNDVSATPVSTVVYTALGTKSQEIDNKMDSAYPVALDWAKVYGDDDYPLGWQNGYYNSSGATGTSDDYMRTKHKKYYIAQDGDQSLVFSVPSGRHALIIEYNASGVFSRKVGDKDSGDNVVSCTVTAGYKYVFCIGKWSGDAADDITSEFLATVTASVNRTVISWQQEQDERLSALEAGENAIPDYYFSNGYLQGKADDITEIQNTISKNQDAFWVISDYHHQYNTGHSMDLLKWLTKRTGITKLIFLGDAGGQLGSTDADRYHRLQQSAEVWAGLADCVDDYYGVLGNHEWINTGTINAAGVMGAYINRYKVHAGGMDAATGNYWFDNIANKIRYLFVQDSYSAAPVSGSMAWLYYTLMATPADYSIVLCVHHGYIPSSASEDEYDGVEITYNYVTIKGMSKLLAACRDKTSTIVNDYTYDFSSLTGDRHIIGVFCGHLHHGFLYTEGTDTGVENIAVFRASTDCMHAASVAVDGSPWFWQDGIVGGTKVVREAGMVLEQCFYAVQVDLAAKHLYITAVGGDHDWDGVYEPST